MLALRLPTVSFGAVSAIVTSMGLIIGFGAAGISKPTIVAGLLIVGLADNLTDSLSIHIYQESEMINLVTKFPSVDLSAECCSSLDPRTGILKLEYCCIDIRSLGSFTAGRLDLACRQEPRRQCHS